VQYQITFMILITDLTDPSVIGIITVSLIPDLDRSVIS